MRSSDAYTLGQAIYESHFARHSALTSRERLEKCDGQPRLTPSKDFPRNMVTSVPTFSVDSIHKDSLEYLTYRDNVLNVTVADD
ncbi:hypothetical protein SeMB42_g05084 [Synchytrium endobioticum]|uniref:Uncharacterized protein n=1 Tax=Synchytrium endobioticum TaxID=286115 RepID=A0A507CTZ6_9FUNG|nr:hypothetical protein SeMB42_g05084 [Synchytrium endobioticum]